MIFATSIPPFSSFGKIAQMNLNNSGPNVSEVSSALGGNIVNDALEIGGEYINPQIIKYIGLTNDSSVLGVASTEYNEMLLQKLFEQADSSQNPEEAEKIKFEINTLRTDHSLHAFQINPQTISRQAEDLTAGIGKELEMNGRSFEDIPPEGTGGRKLDAGQVLNDLKTIILASVFGHESKHAEGKGEMAPGAESGAEEAGNAVINKAVTNLSVCQQYNYLNDFQIIQNNINKG